MNDPWFRQYAPLTIVPIRWQGWAASVAMLALVIPLGLLFVSLVDEHPFLGWTFAGLGAATLAAFHALMFWKLERRYGD